MKKQLVILSSIVVPLLSVTAASCSTGQSIVAVAEKLRPSGVDSKGGVQLTIQLKPTKQHPQISQADRDRVEKVIASRINGLGIKRADIKSIGNNRILIQLPGVKDPQQAERVLGGAAQLEFREQKVGAEEKLSAELAVLNAAKDKQVILKKSKSPDKQAIAANQAAIDKQYTEIGKLFGKATLTGGHLKDANAQPVSGEAWEIAIEFDDFGSNAFTKLTKKLAGTGRSIGVFLDNDPISTPTVGPTFAATGITGGKAVITGNFTAETANNLAVQIRSGSFPVPVAVVEVKIVPPK